MKNRFRIVTTHDITDNTISEISSIQHANTSFFGLKTDWRDVGVEVVTLEEDKFAGTDRYPSFNYNTAKTLIDKLRHIDNLTFHARTKSEDTPCILYKNRYISIAADDSTRFWYSLDFDSEYATKTTDIYKIYKQIDDEDTNKAITSTPVITYID